MKKGLLTIVFLSLTGICFGQANAGSEVVSVNMFTGTGTTHIPVYSQKVGNLDFGVSLSYNMKGVTVDELSSSVGLGWILHAGGSISRQSRGLEDEVCLPAALIDTLGHLRTMLDTVQGILVPGLLYNIPAGDPRYDDTEPDKFMLNLGSRSVEFAYKYNALSTPIYITNPQSELKIEIFTNDISSGGSYTNIRNGVTKHIGRDSMKNVISFKVTDEAGNRFYFERGDYERKDYELPLYQQTPDTGIYYATQTWNLRKVETVYGQVVMFNYISKYVENVIRKEETYDPGAPTAYYPLNVYSLRIKEKVWKGWKTHISKIEFPGNQEILFDIDSSINARCDCKRDFRLKNIIVRSERSSTYKNSITYRLNQSFFNSPAPYISATEVPITSNCNTSTWPWSFPVNLPQNLRNEAAEQQLKYGIRLKLNGIDRIGTNATTTESYYTFEYNTTPLPYRFSPSRDFYGYNNGKTSVPMTDYNDADQVYGTYYLSIPYRSDINAGINRADDFSYTQSFVLNKITNAFGGITNVTYKDYSLENPNCSYGNLTTYPSPFAPINCTIDAKLEGDTVNDGLVVWKISTSDKFNQEANATTEYTYLKGTRFFRGGYTLYPRSNAPNALNIYTNEFTIPVDFFQGSNHGFDTVVMTVSGYNNELITKRKFTFSNLMYYDAGSNYVSSIKLPTGDKLHFAVADFNKSRLGLMLKEEVFDENNNITSTRINRYKLVTGPIEVKGSSRSRGFQNINPTLDNFGLPAWTYRVVDNELYLLDSLSAVTYERTGIGNPPKLFSQNYQYQYDQYSSLRRVLWKDSEGQLFKKYLGYNYNYGGIAGCGNQLINALGLQHTTSSEVWKVSGNDSLLLSYSLSVPSYWPLDSVVAFPVIFGVPLSAPMSSTNANNNSYIDRHSAMSGYSNVGQSLKKNREVTRYDEKYHELEAVIPEENIYSASVWDMDYDQVIAEVSNAQYHNVAYSSFEGEYGFQSQYNKGNWNFDEGYATSTHTAITGKYAFTLSPGINDISSNTLEQRPYVLSYWLYRPNTNSIFSVDLFTGSGTTILTPVLRKTVGNWKLYTVQFTPPNTQSQVFIYTSNGTVGTNSVYIDELRLYPSEATMNTITYKPLFGKGSICSSDDQITYFEYDEFGSLKIERDMNGNIRAKNEYQKREAATNPAAVSQTTY